MKTNKVCDQPSSPESVDEFLWAPASSGSEDCEMTTESHHSKTKKNKRSKKKRKLSVSCESETELERKVKRELINEAVGAGTLTSTTSTGHADSPFASADTQENKVTRRKKKRKLSVASETELESKVKRELISDTESIRVPGNTRHTHSTHTAATPTPTVKRERADVRASPDNDYLELRVKQEHTHTTASSNQTDIAQESDKIFSECESKKGSKKKKHKKKKKRYNKSDVEDEFSAAETVVQSPLRNGIGNSHMSVDSDTPRNRRLDSQCSDNLDVTAADQSRHNNTTTHQHSDSDISDRERHNTSNNVGRSKSMIVSSTSAGPNHKLSISESIAFEDDIEESFQLESLREEQQVGRNINRAVDNYMKEESLRHIKEFIPSALLDRDDDVWLIKSPSEVSESALSAAGLPVEGKGKVKVDGKTYESSLDSDVGHLNVLLCADSKHVIQKVPLKGVVYLRRKLPKPHVPQGGAVRDNACIPLPSTKLRHPLLGANYSAALQLRADVARRLCAAVDAVTKVKKKKKRDEDKTLQEEASPRKRKRSQREADASAELAPASCTAVGDATQAVGDDRHKAKKKKRKREEESEASERGAPPRKRHKAKRQSAAAADAGWDSAQAIEQNLFDL